jgi:tetratricopeptide (TPR) repeat protein
VQRCRRLVCLALIAGGILNVSAQDDPRIVQHFRAGQAAAEKQQFDQAIAEFRAVLQIDPGLVQARANLGLMYYLSARYDDAAKELSRVTQGDPQLLPGELFLGLSYLELGALDAAIPPLKKAQQLDPSNTQAARGLLACYVNLGKYREAAAELQFFENQPGEEALYITGQAYLDIGRALTLRMAHNYPSSAWSHRLAGDLAADRSDWSTAVDEYQKAQTADPSITGLQQSLAAAQARRKETDNSRSESDALPAPAADSPEALYKEIRADTIKGEQAFKKLQDLYPDSPYAHELRGDVYRLSQDFPSALAEFKAALTKRADDATLHRSAAEMDILLGHIDDARAELEAAAKLKPGNSETEYLFGQVCSKSGETEIAVEHLQQALRRDPSLLPARALLGTAYMHLNKPALAAPELEKALPLDFYGDLHFQLYKAYRALGKTAASQRALAESNELRAKSTRSAVAKISGTENLDRY